MSPKLRVAFLALASLAAAGATFFLLLRRGAPEPVASPPVPRPFPPAPPPPSPPPDAGALARALASPLSPSAAWAQWLGVEDLPRRFVAFVASVADGDSPRLPASFLAPDKPFAVSIRDFGTWVDPASYSRYDAVADTLASVDAGLAARAFERLEPVLDAYYREIAPPGARFRDALGKALRRLLSVPVLDQPPRVEARPVVYKYVDPRLESLSDAEKHLLRMGPRNVKRVQEKLRELARALQLER